MKQLLGILAFVLLLAPSAGAQNEIAVIRDRHSLALDQIYYGFAAAIDKRFVNYDYTPGKEAEIGKGVRMENPRMVFYVGDPSPEMLAALDPKIPLLILGHGHPGAVKDDGGQRTIVQLEKDIYPEQVLKIVGELFPGKRRVGFAYNPKLTQGLIDEYRGTNAAKDMQLFLLKVDQPNDLPNLMPTFKDKIDVFLVLMDATVIKAGANAMAPFLRDYRVPMLSTCELFTGDGNLITMEVNPFSLGRMAASIATKMIAGQTSFATNFEKRDITLTFSLKEAYKIKYGAETLQELLERAAGAGYNVIVKP